MSRPIPEPHESWIAERYEQGERQGADSDEQSILQSYERIHAALHSLPLPEIDHSQLVATLRVHSNRQVWIYKMIAWKNDFLLDSRRMATAFCILIFMLLGVGGIIFYPSYSFINNVSFVYSDHSTSESSWWWNWKLSHGYTVSIPKGTQSRITLNDHSTLLCSPESQLALSPHSERRIFMYRGEVRIQATPNPNVPMIVDTPLGDVTVVGTEFTVRILK